MMGHLLSVSDLGADESSQNLLERNRNALLNFTSRSLDHIKCQEIEGAKYIFLANLVDDTSSTTLRHPLDGWKGCQNPARGGHVEWTGYTIVRPLDLLHDLQTVKSLSVE